MTFKSFSRLKALYEQREIAVVPLSSIEFHQCSPNRHWNFTHLPWAAR